MALEDFYTGRRDSGRSVDDVTNLERGFYDRLYALLLAVPGNMAGKVSIISGQRSVAVQQELWDKEYKKQFARLGNADAAHAATRKKVAPPGKSNHQRGLAADLQFSARGAKQWIHENAKRYGLGFFVNGEDWHIEPIGVREGTYVSSGAGGQPTGSDPPMPPEPYMPDFDAYVDDFGTGLEAPQQVNNASLETQLLRLADLMSADTYAPRNAFIVQPQAQADKNLQRRA